MTASALLLIIPPILIVLGNAKEDMGHPTPSVLLIRVNVH